MKAVVLEIKDGYAAVLSEDGQFRKIKDDGYTPGMELTLEQKDTANPGKAGTSGKVIDFRSRRLWKSVAGIAAALMVFIGVKDFYTPYGTVSLDVNPSIEISINRYDKVLSIEAVNEDAEELVDELNASGLKYKSVDDAVDQALSSFSEGDYEAEDGTTYVVISAHSGSSRHSDKIADELDHVCKEHKDISAQTVTASDELHERAKKSGTTAGKLYLVDSLKDASGEEDFDEAEWLEKPVKEIMREIDDRKETAEDAPESKPDAKPDEPDEAVSDEPEQETVPEPKPDALDAPDETLSDEPLTEAVPDPKPDAPDAPDETLSDEPEQETVPEPKPDALDAPDETLSVEPEQETVPEPKPDALDAPDETLSVEPEQETIPEPKPDAPDAPDETLSDEPEQETVPEPKPDAPDALEQSSGDKTQ